MHTHTYTHICLTDSACEFKVCFLYPSPVEIGTDQTCLEISQILQESPRGLSPRATEPGAVGCGGVCRGGGRVCVCVLGWGCLACLPDSFVEGGNWKIWALLQDTSFPPIWLYCFCWAQTAQRFPGKQAQDMTGCKALALGS